MENDNPQTLVSNFLGFYAANKHKPELRALSDYLLAQALSVRGYNNYQTSQLTGEKFFINNILAPANPELCFDIGANTGGYSRLVLEATDSKVIAFEPLPSTFTNLRAQLANYSTRIMFENLGVGNKCKQLALYYNEDASSHASFSVDVNGVSYLRNTNKISVPIITLDYYFKEKEIKKVDLVKIDVEGFESEVIEGAKSFLRICQPKYVQLEFNWHQLFRNKTLSWFADQLTDYECYQLLPNDWAKRDARDPLCNIYLFSNFVFVRRH